MTAPAALQKLVTWLSPAFPVGAFAWSAGLETAIADKRVTSAERLQSWLEGALHHGGIKTDAILLAAAWRAVRCPDSSGRSPDAAPPPAVTPAQAGVHPSASSGSELDPCLRRDYGPGEGLRTYGKSNQTTLSHLADLGLALISSRERWLETTITGDSYVRAAAHWPAESLPALPEPCPYPIAVGAIAAAHDIDLSDTLLAWLTATVHGQVSVAIRLVPLGQSDGLRVMSALEPHVAALASAAASATLADLGAIAYAADIAQMRHETLEPRIFRS
jgi:urease accessory protein